MARAISAALVLAGAASLSGCSSVVVDHWPAALGGLPEGAPQRPATPATYPAVHDMPVTRNDTVLTEPEKKRLRDELIATRERAVREGAANPDAPPAGAPVNP